MAVNIFKFLLLKPFLYDARLKRLLESEINKKIDFIRDTATEGQKTSFCSRAQVSDEDELIEYLEAALDNISNDSFVQMEASKYFDELYGNFLRQFPLLVEKGIVYQDELDELLKKCKIDLELFKELVEYKKDSLPAFKLKDKRPTIVKMERKLIPDNDYNILKSFLGNKDKPSIDKLCDFFGVKQINSGTELKALVDKKSAKIDARLEASSDLVFYNILKKYCTKGQFSLLLESLYINDIIGLFEAKWEGFIKDGVLSGDELRIIYDEGILKGFKPTQITDTLKYWCEKNEKYLFIPSEIELANDDMLECPFCGERYYKAVSVCPKCNSSLSDSLYLIDKLHKFCLTEGSYKFLLARHKEIVSSIGDKIKIASSEIKNLIEQNKDFLKRKNQKKKRIINSLAAVTIILGIAFLVIYFISYRPFINSQEVETIHIKTKDDFMKMINSKDLNDNYILDNDISFYGDEIKPIGSIDNPFTGRFYGNGYTISNFSINEESAALFMYNQGYIERLGVESYTIGGLVYASSFVYQNEGQIKDCYCYDVTLSVDNAYGYGAGFVINNGGEISSCYASIKSFSGQYIYSGFVLDNQESGTINDSFGNSMFELPYIGIGDFYVINKGLINNVYTNVLDDATHFDYFDNSINRRSIVYDDSLQESLGWSNRIWNLSDHFTLVEGDVIA